MSEPTRYPLVKDTERESRTTDMHAEIDVTWAGGQPPQRFCGDNWCTGKCGLPALIIPWSSAGGRNYWAKASGSQVACGALMQGRRVEWTGATVEVPPEHRADFEKRLWW